MKIIMKGDYEIKSIEMCCYDMSSKIKNTRFDVNSNHLWINQKIISFCDSCGESVTVENGVK